jgi:hypothetical protein
MAMHTFEVATSDASGLRPDCQERLRACAGSNVITTGKMELSETAPVFCAAKSNDVVHWNRSDILIAKENLDLVIRDVDFVIATQPLTRHLISSRRALFRKAWSCLHLHKLRLVAYIAACINGCHHTSSDVVPCHAARQR